MKRQDEYAKSKPATMDLPFGGFKNESQPGARDGTDIKAEHMQDIQYALYQVLQLAGIVPNGELEDGKNKRQFLQSLVNAGVMKYAQGISYGASVLVWNIVGEVLTIYKSAKAENSDDISNEDAWVKIVSIDKNNKINFHVNTNISPSGSNLTVFCFNSGLVDTEGKAACVTVANDTLTLAAGSVCTSAGGTTYTVPENISIDISSLTAGTHNFAYDAKNQTIEEYSKVVISSTQPENFGAGDIWLDNSVMPYSAKMKNSSGEIVAREIIPIPAKLDMMTANLIKEPYNQNGIYNPYYLNKTQLTNCVLEVPHNIDIQLDKTTQVLNWSTESIAIFPDGFEADGTTKKFLYKSGKALTLNVSNFSHTSGLLGIGMIENILNNIEVFPLNLIVSSDTMPGGSGTSSSYYWYDTANNMCYIVQGGAIQRRASLPIAHFTGGGTGVGITNIDTVFNGAGFMDQIVWVDKDLKVLISNGKNADDTNKNKEYTTEKLCMSDETGKSSRHLFLNLQHDKLVATWGGMYQTGKQPTLVANYHLVFYNELTNYLETYDVNNNVHQIGDQVYLGQLNKTSNSASITSLSLAPFKILTPYEQETLDEPDLSAPISIPYNTEYVIKEPGWVYFNTHLRCASNYNNPTSSIQVYGRVIDNDKQVSVYGNLLGTKWDGSSNTVTNDNMTSLFIRVYPGQRVKLLTTTTSGNATVASYECNFYPLKRKGV